MVDTSIVTMSHRKAYDYNNDDEALLALCNHIMEGEEDELDDCVTVEQEFEGELQIGDELQTLGDFATKNGMGEDFLSD